MDLANLRKLRLLFEDFPKNHNLVLIGRPNLLTPAAIDLVVRSADGVLRKARNLCVGCLIEAVRAANRTIDIDNVNRVLMQPHWQQETELAEF
jgi:hypothetical protein